MSIVQSLAKEPKKFILRKIDLTPSREYATPYVVTDLKVVEDKVTRFRKLLPQVGIYYAIKANNDVKIIKRLRKYVEGYDIASLGEAQQLTSLGIAADRLMYSNPVKVPSHIAAAYALGVRNFAFDSLMEIEKLATYAPGSNVYLRLKVSDYGSKFPLSRKFGTNALHAVDYCSVAQDAGLHVKGVTFHVGSQSENPQVWERAIKVAGEVIKQLQEKGIEVEFLNLGGGFPADYGDPIPGLGQVAQVIKQSLKAHVPEGIRVIAEPGRYLAANTSVLTASVIGCENRDGVDWLYLDIGAFQGLIEPLEMPNLRYPIKTNKNPRCLKKVFVVSGPTCDAYDTLGSDYLLPADLKVGDKLTIEAVGAYSFVYASNFNGFAKPEVYYVNE